MDWLWSVRAIDYAMIIALVSFPVAIILSVFLMKRRDAGRETHKHLTAVYGLFLVILGTYIAYGTLRNQLRMSAENALNDEGNALFAIEMGEPTVRCLYDNYGHYQPGKCLAHIVSDDKEWSVAIFYVEESWLILQKAHEDRPTWGSDYATSIKYWAEDIGRDPTGLFSYYLVSSSATVAEAKQAMVGAGVCIPNLCERYQHVRIALPEAARDYQRAPLCMSKKDWAVGTSSCAKTR